MGPRVIVLIVMLLVLLCSTEAFIPSYDEVVDRVREYLSDKPRSNDMPSILLECSQSLVAQFFGSFLPFRLSSRSFMDCVYDMFRWITRVYLLN